MAVQALLAAVAAKAPSEEIKGLIEKLQEAGGGIDRPAQSSSYTGSWELLWDFSVSPQLCISLYMHVSLHPCRQH